MARIPPFSGHFRSIRSDYCEKNHKSSTQRRPELQISLTNPLNWLQLKGWLKMSGKPPPFQRAKGVGIFTMNSDIYHNITMNSEIYIYISYIYYMYVFYCFLTDVDDEFKRIEKICVASSDHQEFISPWATGKSRPCCCCDVTSRTTTSFRLFFQPSTSKQFCESLKESRAPLYKFVYSDQRKKGEEDPDPSNRNWECDIYVIHPHTLRLAPGSASMPWLRKRGETKAKKMLIIGERYGGCKVNGMMCFISYIVYINVYIHCNLYKWFWRCNDLSWIRKLS